MTGVHLIIASVVIGVVIAGLAVVFILFAINRARRSGKGKTFNSKPNVRAKEYGYSPVQHCEAPNWPIIKDTRSSPSKSPDTPMEFFLPGDLATSKMHPFVKKESRPRFSMSLSIHEEFGAIDPSMYEIETVDDGTMALPSLGEITFSLFYDTFRSILRVTLNQAKNLALAVRNEESKHLNPYVTITLQPEYRHLLQSKVKQKTRNPVFNQSFEFEVKFPDLSMQTLWLTVFNFLSDSRHNVIGQTVLPLEDLQHSDEQAFTMDLKPTTEKMPLGDILFSLGYLRIAGRLTLIVMKARNLPQVSVKGTDPCVRVNLIKNGRRTKKKKTSVKKNKVNPVFNEAISFDIPCEGLDTTGLLLTVIHENKVIGCVLVGCSTDGKGLEHWNRMKTSDKPIAEWHPLQDGRKYY